MSIKQTPTKRALVIAVSEYDKLQKLDVCARDGQEVCKLLKKIGFVVRNKHKLIGRVTHEEMRHIIIDFFRDPDISSLDTMLFYFSGHGFLGNDDDHYFASSELDPKYPKEKGLAFDEYTSFMTDCGSKTIFSILDCCYAGALKLGKGGENDEALRGKNFIKQKSLPEGRFILSSCKPMQKSYLLQKHSAFTNFLLEGLQGGQGPPCTDDEGCVTPQSLVNYIQNEIGSMPSDTRPQQTPFLNSQTTGGKLILNQLKKYAKLKVSQPMKTKGSKYYLERGNYWLYRNNSKKAIGFYDKIINDPNYLSAIYNKGISLDKLKKYQEATKWYDKALAINPRFIHALQAKRLILQQQEMMRLQQQQMQKHMQQMQQQMGISKRKIKLLFNKEKLKLSHKKLRK